MSYFLSHWQENLEYIDMLSMMASLSRLFSESEVPYLDYRLAENLFCKYYNAVNDARSCTAYDAHIGGLGIGIKTFILRNDESTEKIAEFNKLKPQLDPLSGFDLAVKLGQFRNDRMFFANNGYGICSAIYHIVGRDENMLKVFNTEYDFVDIDHISHIKESKSSIHFEDGKNHYSFNKSKSVLMKHFVASPQRIEIPIEILDDPLSLLEMTLKDKLNGMRVYSKRKGIDFVVLPLYSTRTNTVPERSGLNQWNANGRQRNENEVYIPIPQEINHRYPNFFPPKDCPFLLYLPDGSALLVKKCQSREKALMSNPNSALGEWLLRKVMGKKPGEMVTMTDLDILGFNSVVIYNHHATDQESGLAVYSIQFDEIYGDYSTFLE